MECRLWGCGEGREWRGGHLPFEVRVLLCWAFLDVAWFIHVLCHPFNAITEDLGVLYNYIFVIAPIISIV